MASAAARMLEQCVASPDDDEPRLVWADAIGGERGELVVLQCDLARGGLPPHEVAVRRRRERELLARHGAGWSGLDGIASRWNFHRGFVESVRVDLAAFARDPRLLFAAAPLVTGIAITNLCTRFDPATRDLVRERPAPEALGLLASALANAAFTRVRALEIVEPFDIDARGFRAPLADDVAALLSAYGVGHLTALGIWGGALGERGMAALGALAEHATLNRIWLRDQALRTEDCAALMQRFPAVTSVELGGGELALDQLGSLLERPLRSLALGQLRPDGLARLVASPAAQTLEHLALLDVNPARGHIELAFPALRSLELSCMQRSDAMVRRLADARLPALRELAIRSYASPEALAAIADRFGGQLDVLDLRGCFGNVRGIRVAGEILVHEATPPQLPHASAPPQLAAWSRPMLDELRDHPLPRAFLVALRGRNVWELPPDRFVTIGRGSDCTIKLDDTGPIDQHHCTIRWRGGWHELGAWTTTGGTQLDGRTLEGHAELDDGSRIRLGTLELVYLVGDDAEQRARALVNQGRGDGGFGSSARA